MLAGLSHPRPRTPDELLGPDLVARLDRLDLLSRKVLAGKLPGERRSKRRGRSVEFDDFRPYIAGDDLRHIDWNIVGRLDKLFVKLFREEEDLALHIFIDASASMDVGNPNKLVFACRLAAALGYIGLVNQNRVSIATFGLRAPWTAGSPADSPGGASESVRTRPTELRHLAPMRGRSSVRRLTGFLLETLDLASRRLPATTNSNAPTFADAMRELGRAASGRGVTLVLSDFLLPAGYESGLAYLMGSAPGLYDAWCVQVLSPAELDPAKDADAGLTGDLRLTDVESGRGVEVTITPASIARYRAGIEAHRRALRDACLARGIACELVATDTPIPDLLVNTLRKGGLLR